MRALRICPQKSRPFNFRVGHNIEECIFTLWLLCIEFLPVIFALDVNGLAHLKEARAQAHSDTIFQRLVALGAAGIQIIGGEDSQLLIVVARIDDLHHRVSNPIGRLRCSKLIEHQHFGIEHGREHFQLGSLRDRIVGILNLFEERAELIKQACDALLLDQLADDRDREMSLADADRPHKQYAAIDRRIFLCERARIVVGASLDGEEFPLRDLVVLYRAFIVTARDACRFEQFSLVLLHAATATPCALARNDLHAGAKAERADRCLLRDDRMVMRGSIFNRRSVGHAEKRMDFSVVG